MRRQIPYLTKNEEEALCLNRVADKVESVMDKQYLQWTHFLTVKEQVLATKMMQQKGLPDSFLWGGYPDSERQILMILPDYMEEEILKESLIQGSEEDPLSYLRVHYSSFRPLRHGDFLGSILGLGLDREVVGDLLPGENHCDIIVQKEIETFLLTHYHQAGRATLTVEKLPGPEALIIPERRFHKEEYALASLRLDGYVSEVFRLSRDDAKTAVQSGLVQVNGMEETKGHRELEEGDTISFRRKGKTLLKELGGTTRKNRQWIVVLRYE